MNERAMIDYKILAKQAPEAVVHAESGLPNEVFSFIASITPMVNVDLLVVRNAKVLLSWRDDGKNLGWHIPGGIVRFKESFESRIQKTAQKELGTEVSFVPEPIKISQIIMPYQRRGHFISFLYRCWLPTEFEINNGSLNEKEDGYLKWFDYEPEELVQGQSCYREVLRRVLNDNYG